MVTLVPRQPDRHARVHKFRQTRRLLLFALHGHEPQARPLSSFANRFSIDCVVLLSLHERFDVGGRDQSNFMAKLGELTSPVMCAATCLQRTAQLGREATVKLKDQQYLFLCGDRRVDGHRQAAGHMQSATTRRCALFENGPLKKASCAWRHLNCHLFPFTLGSMLPLPRANGCRSAWCRRASRSCR